MSSLKIQKPNDKDTLEDLACEIYRVEWNTTEIQVVGRSGLSQGGIDIIGTRSGAKVGVQCKCYHTTPFTKSTITGDVEKADKAEVKIDCLIFVTTWPRESKVATDCHDLSAARRAQGKFGVEVLFWEDFEALLLKHPAVTARYAPDHPLSISQRTLSTAESTKDTAEAIRALLEQLPGDQALIKRQLEDIAARLPSAAASTAVPVTNHDTDHRESTGRASVEEIRQEAMIDVVRDMIREIRTSDALLQLKKLGNPDDLASNWLRFRWYTNAGAIAWLNGETETSFEHYERAYELMPSDPKAIANRMRSLMLAGQVEAARKLCRQTIAANPGHEHAWSVLIALDRLNEDGLRALGPPAAILGSRDVQFALGAAAGARGEHELATRLFAECLRGEPASHEVRRALVTSCVTWAVEGGIGGVPSLLSESLRQYLTEALSPLTDALSRIENTEAHPFALELANNSFVGLKLLGEDGLASQLAVRFFHRFPTAPALVAAAARENDTATKWPRFRDELMQRLDQLSAAGRIAVGEVAANLGDLTWFTACAAQPAPDESDARTPLILRLLETVAVWKSGERDAAVAAMRSFNKEHPKFVLGSTMLSQMLRIAGDHAGAISALAAALKLVDANTIGSDKLAMADAFFECDAYVVAAKLYSDLVQRPGDDQATFRLVRSLIAINDRQGAARVLARVPTELRDAYPIRRLELLLAHEVGDLNRLVELLKAERVRSPQRGEIALNLAAAYLLMNRFDELRTLLADNHAFEQTPPRIEFEFAKLQLQFGEPEKGHERLIALWRNTPPTESWRRMLFRSRPCIPIPRWARRQHCKAPTSPCASGSREVPPTGLRSTLRRRRPDVRGRRASHQAIQPPWQFARRA